jgi:hypothetical protein
MGHNKFGGFNVWVQEGLSVLLDLALGYVIRFRIV